MVAGEAIGCNEEMARVALSSFQRIKKKSVSVG
jgi:hypothetical protein